MTTGNIIPTETERTAMRAVTDHARQLAEEGYDIIFTAAIVKDDKIIAQARNEAADTNDVSRHAEVVVISKATDALGTRDLTGATLITSCQPCEMCLATMRWARISRVIFAAQQENTKPEFFRFPGLKITDYHTACDGCFDWYGGLDEDRVAHIYARKETS